MIPDDYKIDNSLLMLIFQVIQLYDFHNRENLLTFDLITADFDTR